MPSARPILRCFAVLAPVAVVLLFAACDTISNSSTRVAAAPTTATGPANPIQSSRPPELQRAAQFQSEQRYEEARRIYESWLEQHPQDADATFDLGYTLYLQSCAAPTAPSAPQLRLRARDLIVRARAGGSTRADLIAYDRAIGADGSDLRQYQANPAAAEAIKRGEAAFSAGRLQDALSAYQAALAADPRAYAAALFSGDAYFGLKNYPKANEWFSKAVGIDPSIETAHRYWGDSLVRQGRPAEALPHYLDAVLAEPYNRVPREVLARFAQARGRPQVNLGLQRFPADVTLGEKGPQLSLPPDVDPLTLAYALARAQWLTEERSKYFAPDAPARHSLPEEVHALRTVIRIGREMKTSDAAQRVAAWQPTVEALAALDREGLLPAYVLFDAADAGLAQDYENYRRLHRDQLLRYLRKIWSSSD